MRKRNRILCRIIGVTLPFEPVTEIRKLGHPVISWTVRSKEEASQALRYCDQVTFEGFNP